MNLDDAECFGPERRYGSAEMLADDLEHWLRGEPILARPISRPKRLLKWARRRPERAVLYGLATLVLGVGLGWSGWQGWQYVETQRLAAAQVIAEKKRLEEQKDGQREAERGDHRYRAKWNLEIGREACRYGRFDVGMLQLARGLRRAVAGEAADIESELRLELGRYAPRLPRIVTMRWNGQGVQTRYGFDRTYGISLSRDGKRMIAAGATSVCDVDASLRLKPAFTEKDPSGAGWRSAPTAASSQTAIFCATHRPARCCASSKEWVHTSLRRTASGCFRRVMTAGFCFWTLRPAGRWERRWLDGTPVGFQDGQAKRWALAG